MKVEKNSLLILHLKQEDAGDYYCTGTNSFSKKSKKIHVFVYGMYDVMSELSQVRKKLENIF